MKKEKQHVFVLWHVHKFKGRFKDQDDDSKLIGIYSSRRQAVLARTRSKKLKGFRDLPRGFVIDKYEIGMDHWTEGYTTIVYGKKLRANKK
jgi:hypothetical protein